MKDGADLDFSTGAPGKTGATGQQSSGYPKAEIERPAWVHYNHDLGARILGKTDISGTIMVDQPINVPPFNTLLCDGALSKVVEGIRDGVLSAAYANKHWKGDLSRIGMTYVGRYVMLTFSDVATLADHINSPNRGMPAVTYTANN